MSAFCNTDVSPHFLSFVQSPHYTGTHLICIWIISQTSAWLWQALMTENCRHSKETHSFAPNNSQQQSPVLTDLLHFTTNIHQHLLASLCICHHTTTWGCMGCWPISEGTCFGLGFSAQPLGGRVLWLRDLALFANLFISSSSLCFLSLFSHFISHNLHYPIIASHFRTKNKNVIPHNITFTFCIYLHIDSFYILICLSYTYYMFICILANIFS